MITKTAFLNKLKTKGNNKSEFDSILTKATIQLYKNGFKIINDNNNNNNTNKFYSFNNGVNQTLLTDIMETKFPLDLLPITIDKAQCHSIGVIIEDYSDQTYFAVNSNDETTTITVKLANGSIFTQIFNVYHTLSDVIEQISFSKMNSVKSFGLLFGYPPKEITELQKTIHELNLKSGTLIQKLNDK